MARLLIVDDEAMLLSLLRRYLERQGFEVETSVNAEDALETFAAAPDSFDMVVTDLTLPGANGEDLIRKMRRQKPSLRAMIASGYPHVPQLAGVGFLQKPFLPQTLVEEIQKSLKR
jgi:two-component system response regulator HydG